MLFTLPGIEMAVGLDRPAIYFSRQGFGDGAGSARSRGIWLEQEPSLWHGSGSGSTLNIC